MSRVAVDTDWLRRIGGLTVEPDGQWPQDQIVAARLLVMRLVAVARPLATCRAAAAACPPMAADLAPELADADVPDIPWPSHVDAQQVAGAYLTALSAATGAVYFCRRVEHASGRCWFSRQGPSADLCGRVLAAGHHCSVH